MFGIGAWGSWLLVIIFGGAYALGASCANAQITPDRTLPNNSNVTINGSIFNITGGTQAGRNLFHSFQQFSVPTGGTASFMNGADIQNIISRVTGGSTSSIDGLIRASGAANVFFLNPSGIVFGQHASLNVGGSFVATTANAIQFGNIGIFSATTPDAPSPLLTINPTALLFNQIATAPIQNNSTAPAGRDPAGFRTFGLRVPDGKSLLLAGGNISMDGGQLNAYGGRVELGGLASSGTVGIQVNGNDLSLSFPDNVIRSDVSLANGASVYVEASGGGSITVNAHNLNIPSGSQLSAGIGRGLGSVGAQAGDITLNATGDIKIDGTGSDIPNIINRVEQQAIGNGGNITLYSHSLFLTGSAQISTSTFGQGNAGNVTINATKSVSLDGSNTIAFSNVGSFNNTQNNLVKGNGGNIEINTSQLELTNGAQLQTVTFGQGNAGNVIISALKSVSLENALVTTSVGSFNNTQNNFVQGNGGNIQITTDKLSLRNRAVFVTTTFGQGNAGSTIINASKNVSLDNAFVFSTVGVVDSSLNNLAKGNGGNIQITTNQLSLTNGAQLLVSTYGQGNAGNVIINASKSVFLDGRYTDSNDRSLPSAIFSSSGSVAKGKAGDIQINTSELSLSKDAELNASTFGQSDAGNIKIAARSIRLDNGSITSETNSGNGGDITLTAQDYILLRNNSLISTTAGTAQKGGNGGNITINTPFVIALPQEKSDITANAFSGTGGQIQINATSVFGLTVLSREDLIRLLGNNDLAQLDFQRLPTSAITAVSQTNPTLNGTVVIDTANINPSLELVPLPTNLINPSTLIANSCIARTKKQQGTFNITGTGGLPNHPGDAFMSSYPTGTVRNVEGNSTSSSWHKGDPIVEPLGVYQLPNGHLVLSRECS